MLQSSLMPTYLTNLCFGFLPRPQKATCHNQPTCSLYPWSTHLANCAPLPPRPDWACMYFGHIRTSCGRTDGRQQLQTASAPLSLSIHFVSSILLVSTYAFVFSRVFQINDAQLGNYAYIIARKHLVACIYLWYAACTITVHGSERDLESKRLRWSVVCARCACATRNSDCRWTASMRHFCREQTCYTHTIVLYMHFLYACTHICMYALYACM